MCCKVETDIHCWIKPSYFHTLAGLAGEGRMGAEMGSIEKLEIWGTKLRKAKSKNGNACSDHLKMVPLSPPYAIVFWMVEQFTLLCRTLLPSCNAWKQVIPKRWKDFGLVRIIFSISSQSWIFWILRSKTKLLFVFGFYFLLLLVCHRKVMEKAKK